MANIATITDNIISALSGTTSQVLLGDATLTDFKLDSLTDVNVTTPGDGDVLRWNATTSLWEASDAAGITGSGANGQVAFFTGATTQSGSNNLFWDATNSRLGINVSNPLASLQIGNGYTDSLYDGFKTTNSPEFLIVSSNANSYHRILGGLYNNASTINLDLALPLTKNLGTNGTGFRITTGVGSGVGTTNGYLAFSSLTGESSETFTATERMRIFASTGNLVLNSTTDNGLRFQVTGDGFFSGSVGIGSTSLTNRALVISRTMTGSTDGYGILQVNTVSSGVTSSAINNYSQFATQAAAFTLSNAYHYYHADISIGAGSTITNQYGYFAANIVAATNNYGFYGNIAAGTGRWNLYMNGSAANYLAGNLGVGFTGYAWPSATKAIDLGTVGGFSTDNNYIAISNNWYWSGSQNLYKISDFATQYVQQDGLHIWTNAPSGTAGTSATFTERMRLDASGNLGLGVVPSAWGAGERVFQIKNRTALYEGASNFGYFTNNYYYDGTNTRYIAAASAGAIAVEGAKFVWYSAGTGTAGAIATFTQPMTLFATGNLAVGTTTDAGFRLDVNGTMRVTGGSVLHTAKFEHTSNDGGINVRNNAAIATNRTAQLRLMLGTTEFGASDLSYQLINIATSTSASALAFQYWNGSAYAERMRIDASGNLGLGVTPTRQLHIYRAGVATEAYIQADAAQQAALYFKTLNNAIYVSAASSTEMRFFVNSADRLMIDGSGNLGLGGTPSAWSAAFKAIQFGLYGALYNSSVFVGLGSNFYSDGTAKYLSNGSASLYEQSSGQHRWYNAPNNSSGAGAALTFTQPMTLFATGNLAIGTTTDAGFRLDVNGTAQIRSNLFLGVDSSSNARIYLYNASNTSRGELYFDGNNSFRIESTYGGTGTYRPMTFWTSATERMRLDASGNLGLGVTPSAWRSTERALQIGSYTAVSDVLGYSSIGNNFFVNASNQFIYLNTAATSVYSQNAGSHIWQSAASGTAGTSFSFTTRMTLFQTGNLTIGSTTTDAGFRLDVNGTMRVSGIATVSGKIVAGDASAIAGQMTLEQVYSAGNVLGSISTQWGTGAMVLGYGARGKSGANGYTSTFSNFSGRRAVLEIGQGTLQFLNTASVNTAVGSDLTTTLLFSIADTGAATFSSSVTAGSFISNGSITASSAIARGINTTNTLVAAANNDNLVALDINPTYTNGAFTGVGNIDLRTKFAGVVIGSSYGYGSNYGTANDGIVQIKDAGTGILGGVWSTQMIFRQAGNATGYNSNYWSTIESSSAGFLVKSGNYMDLYLRAGGNGSDEDIIFEHGWGTTPSMKIIGTTKNVLIGVASDAGYRVDINGTIRVSGVATFSSTVNASNGTLIGGTGNSGYIPKFTGANAVANSPIKSTTYAGGVENIEITSTLASQLYLYNGTSTLQIENYSDDVFINFSKGAFNNTIFKYNGSSTTSRNLTLGTESLDRIVIKHNGQVRFVPLSSDPAGAEAGDVYYNSTTNVLKYSNGTTWNDMAPSSSTYTPTVTLGTNAAAATVGTLSYFKNGSMVHIIGKLTARATANGNMIVDLSLPIASAFTDNADAVGFGDLSTSVFANMVNDRLSFSLAGTTTNTEYGFMLTYIIK